MPHHLPLCDSPTPALCIVVSGSGPRLGARARCSESMAYAHKEPSTNCHLSFNKQSRRRLVSLHGLASADTVASLEFASGISWCASEGEERWLPGPTVASVARTRPACKTKRDVRVPNMNMYCLSARFEVLAVGEVTATGRCHRGM
jgi:hypothetical protein